MPGYSYFVGVASRTVSGVLGGDCARTLLMSSTLSDRTDPRPNERLAARWEREDELDTLRAPKPLRRGVFRVRLDVAPPIVPQVVPAARRFPRAPAGVPASRGGRVGKKF